MCSVLLLPSFHSRHHAGTVYAICRGRRKYSVKPIHGQADNSLTLGDIRRKRNNIVKDT